MKSYIAEEVGRDFQLDIKTEVRRLYDDYNKFPSKLQKEFPFNDYVDLQLELQNKTDMIRNKCYDLARDLLPKDSYKQLHRADINQLDSSINNGTSILASNWETKVPYEIVYTSPSNEHVDGPCRRVDETTNVDNTPSYLDMENTSLLFGDMEINLDEFYGDTRLKTMSHIEEE